jgi:type IV secretion system protein VirD4
MVSGHPPIRAKKLRYYADANFMRRVLPPPALTHGRYADAPSPRSDDWSALAIPAVPSAPAAAGGLGDADEGGPRRPPEQSEAVAYSPAPEHPASDLALLDDDDDLPLPLPSQFDPRLQRAARLAALDPDDGISL